METTNKFSCKYCRKDFVREESLEKHLCEMRRRHQEKDDRGVQLGLQAYLKFYDMTQGSAKKKTFDDFAKSAYYRAFVKFGKYCVAVRVINPSRFTEWLLKNNKKIDGWTKDSLYVEYLVEYLQTEAVVDALTRSIEHTMSWEEESTYPAHDYLRYGNANAISYAISAGRISPWVLYNSESGQKFLSELNKDQIALIWPYINTDFWHSKFSKYPEDKEYAQQILKQAGW